MRQYIILSIIAVTIAAISCSGEKDVGRIGSSSVVARAVSGTGTVAVQPLDHPANPYRGEYGSWDEWMINNCGPDMVLAVGEDLPEGWRAYLIRFDADGFALPTAQQIKMQLESASKGELEEYDDYPFMAAATGVMPGKVKAEYDVAVGAVYRDYFPPVPDWLAMNPPTWTMLLPDGRIIGTGNLGIGLDDTETDDETGCCGGSGKVYALYSNDGQLLRTARDIWMRLMVSDAELDAMDDFGKLHTGYNYRYFAAEDLVSGDIIKAWDYDGSEVSVSIIDDPVDRLPFTHVPADIIHAMGGGY